MKSIFVIVLLLATLALPAHAEEDTCDMLFVQDAKAMTFDGSLLTLKEANPNIIFFCDRPVRTAGHMTRDARVKERKKPGLKRARKAPTYTKR